VVLNRLSQDPAPFDSEPFLSLTSLAHPDPTMTLPVILGILTMANVESGNWVMNAAERQQQRAMEADEARRVAAGGKVRIQPGKIIKSSLRILSIIRIIVAALTPGVRLRIQLHHKDSPFALEECDPLLDDFSSFWFIPNMDHGID